MLHLLRKKEINWVKFNDNMPGEVLISGNFLEEINKNEVASNRNTTKNTDDKKDKGAIAVKNLLEEKIDTNTVIQALQSNKNLSSNDESQSNEVPNVNSSVQNKTNQDMGSSVAHQVFQA